MLSGDCGGCGVKNRLEVQSTREEQLAVGVACHARDDSESAPSHARCGGAKLRRVGEFECLGAEDHPKAIREREGTSHTEARVGESWPAKRGQPRRSEAGRGEVSVVA